MTVTHDDNVIEFIKRNSSESTEKIIKSLEQGGLTADDIFDPSISDDLLEMVQNGDSDFERYAKIVSAIRESFRETEMVAPKKQSNSFYKIHSPKAFNYKSHNELDIKRSLISHALS